MASDNVVDSLTRAGFLVPEPPPESARRFADGARYRVEISSVEGPAVLRAVLEEASMRSVPVQRVSQGSGVMMLNDREIREMAELGAEHSVEVSLFFGPRGDWDIGGQSASTGSVGGAVRGARGLLWCAHEAVRACSLGIRSVLAADLGVLALIASMRAAGDLPADLVIKTSVMLPCTNPATGRALEGLGAGTLNVATDLTLAELAEIRAVTTLPMDIYVESPDDQGGFVRTYEVPDLVRALAPLHLKFGLRNSPSIYPMGMHLQQVAEAMAREKVRRAELGLRLLEELAPDLLQAPPSDRPPDLGVPIV